MGRAGGGIAGWRAPTLVTIDAPEDPTIAPVRVLIVGDNFLEQEGLAALLARTEGVVLLGALEGRAEVLDQIETARPDVVVMDYGVRRSAGVGEVEMALEIRAHNPHVGLVFLTDDQQLQATELFRDGAAGLAVLQKHSLRGPKRLLQAIEEVSAGGSLFDPQSIDSLIARRDGRAHHGLTPRELDVLTLIAMGRKNAAIARILSLTERAVEKHINSIFRKLGLNEDCDQHPRVSAVLAFLDSEPRSIVRLPDGDGSNAFRP